MTGRERLDSIRARLMSEGALTVDTLREIYQVSPETIRRDLAKLVQEGLAIRTYGGVVLSKEDAVRKLEFSVRSETNLFEKRKIGALAAGIILPYQHIGCDASSTTMEMLKNIKEREDVTILTNSIKAIGEMMDSRCHLRSTGGIVDLRAGYMVGHTALEAVGMFNLDITFVSCKGIGRDGTVFDTHESETDMKRAILKRSNKNVLLVDHSKFGKVAFTEWARLKDFDLIITDQEPPAWVRQHLEEKHVQLLYE